GAELEQNSPFKMLNSEAIRLMAQSGNVEIGAHTHSHAILSKLSAIQKDKEILQSIRLIEKWTDSKCSTFAYPNGRLEDYDAECIRLLKDYNIEAAVTASSHRNTPETSRFELGRYGIGSNTNSRSFKLIAHGIKPLFKR
ncbi:MAG: polysaccharide deacetylase family protein, partial [Gammaproteobacteria bacterium]